MQHKIFFFLPYRLNSKNLFHLCNGTSVSLLEIRSSAHEYEYEYDHGNEHDNEYEYDNGYEHDNGNEHDIHSIYISSIWLS